MQANTQIKEQSSITPMWKDAAKDKPAAEAAPDYMGRFYIHRAAPIKGAEPAADGRCLFLLQCYPVPQDATPAQIMKSGPMKPEYHVYYGFMSRQKGDKGMVVGYVEDLYGSKNLEFAGHDMPGGMVATSLKGTILPRPFVPCDTQAPRFGTHDHMAADIHEHIATMAKIDAIRSPQIQKNQRRCCI